MLDEGDLVSETISGSELARPKFDLLLNKAAARPGHDDYILVAVGGRLWRMGDEDQRYQFRHHLRSVGLEMPAKGRERPAEAVDRR